MRFSNAMGETTEKISAVGSTEEGTIGSSEFLANAVARGSGGCPLSPLRNLDTGRVRSRREGGGRGYERF